MELRRTTNPGQFQDLFFDCMMQDVFFERGDMSKRTMAYLVIVLGAVVLIISLAADFWGLAVRRALAGKTTGAELSG